GRQALAGESLHKRKRRADHRAPSLFGWGALARPRRAQVSLPCAIIVSWWSPVRSRSFPAQARRGVSRIPLARRTHTLRALHHRACSRVRSLDRGGSPSARGRENHSLAYHL